MQNHAGRQGARFGGKCHQPKMLFVKNLKERHRAKQGNIGVKAHGSTIYRIAARLLDKLVATRFSHQYFGTGRVAFDFLAQAVNMGFQRMRRHAGIVAPDLR